MSLLHAHLAAAGGGTGGFGGGGGEGGGGRGAGLYILIQILIRIAILGHGIGALVLIGLIILAVIFFKVVPQGQQWFASYRNAGSAARRRTRQRERRVELAAAEAAEDDPAFAPEAVRRQAAHLFQQIERAWDAGDRERLGQLVAPGLMSEWERRLENFERRGWRNRVAVLGKPTVQYVSLQHRGGPSGDRVVVRIEARLRDYVQDAYGNHLHRRGRMSEVVPMREYWTLAKRHGRWILESIEQGGEGSHALDERLVPTPWSDEQSMRDEALVEAAVADAAPDDTKAAELAALDFDGSARAAALDLSVADGRFAPDILEVAARRAVDAWAQAVDGDDAALLELARPDAARELLHPGDPSARTRLVVRGPRVEQIRVVGLDAASEPPTMTIEVEISGRRYIEDRATTALVAGNPSRQTTFTERWTLALDGDQKQPWRIAAAGPALASGLQK